LNPSAVDVMLALVTDGGGWPGDETAETQVLALSPPARQILAALAVVGRASLSAAELAELTETDRVEPLIDDLERRGLIKRDERKRYSTAGRVGAQIRKTDEALASGDRLLQYMATLAKGGKLTPERLLEDAEAILGLSEWAGETGQWAALLEFVKTLEACFSIAHRVDEWLTLLERGRSAARALGDRRSEIWVLQQMAAASASIGDTSAAQRYMREADELQRGPTPTARRVASAEQTVAAGTRAASRAPWIIGLLIAGVVGIGAGYAIGIGGGDNVGETTARVPVTVTLPGQTITTSDTVTLPATTVISTTTELTTTTVTATTTVTVVG
jgi:hypothetical protein